MVAGRVAALVAALVAGACGRADAPGGEPAAPVPTLPPPRPIAEREFLDGVDRTRGRRDDFVPLVDPPFAAAADAPGMVDAEMVIALDLGREQVCYPVRYLDHHEIVEHRLAGLELLVCWCPLCRTAAVHVRVVDGRTLSFGHTGWLWRNAYLLYDRATDSIWHHYWGVAMSGPLRGARMPRIPSRYVAFGAWRAEHPGTLVLRKPGPDARIDVSADVYAARNAAYRFGFGVDAGGASRLYPFDAFPGDGVVEDVLGDVPVAVVRDPGAETAVAYDRRVGGLAVSFRLDTSAADGRPVLREVAGLRAWYLRSGRPVAGTGARAPLDLLPASVWEEAAWSLQHPSGTLRARGAK